MPEFRIAATVSNSHDGLSRLLGDVERFGFRLTSLNLETTGSLNRIEMRFGADEVSCDVVRARLSRHPCISQLNATETERSIAAKKSRKIHHV